MPIFGCCRSRPREVPTATDLPPSFCEKACKNAKTVVCDVMVGAAAGMAFGVPIGAQHAHRHWTTAQRADQMVKALEANWDVSDASPWHQYYSMRANATDSIVPAFARPVLAYTAVGALGGLLYGIQRIVRATWFPNQVHEE